jgi:hypothetical protein
MATTAKFFRMHVLVVALSGCELSWADLQSAWLNQFHSATRDLHRRHSYGR